MWWSQAHGLLLANALLALGGASAVSVIGYLIDHALPPPCSRAAALRRGLARRAVRVLVICAFLLGLSALVAAL